MTLDDRMAEALRFQIGFCDNGGSPFTAALLRGVLEDFNAGGDWRRLLGDWTGDPGLDAAPLRACGALHRLALQGEAPFAALFAELDQDAYRVADAVRAAAARPEVGQWLENPPQTNEAARSAVLLGGFLEIACVQRLPLRLLEIGSSAGLNLMWDRYRYRLGDLDWGPEDSPVRFAPAWTGRSPTSAPIKVLSRRGCDQLPVDITDPEARLRLRSYVWADQQDRVQRVQGALAIAQADPPTLDKADAADWLEAQLAQLPEGVTTVLFHSIAWQYFDEATAARARAAIERAGALATQTRGLAWLAFETTAIHSWPDLTLTLWPGGETRTLAQAHPHGRWVKWKG